MHKNDFAPIPPMGWDSYDYYGTSINETQAKSGAHYLAEHLKPYGWEYIIIGTKTFPDAAAFPSSADGAGYKPLADYIHGLGLKFGIHISTIQASCPLTAKAQLAPVVQAHYDSLLAQYAFWGVDFIQCDTDLHEIGMLSHAIKKCGRPMVLSIAVKPALLEHAWHYATHANIWKIMEEISDTEKDNFYEITETFRQYELWQTHVRKGCYPDCGILPFSKMNGKSRSPETTYTKDEIQTIMTLRCLFGSPLVLGGDLHLLDNDTLKILTQQHILPLRKPQYQPHQVYRDENKAIWQADDICGHEHYVALFNLSSKVQLLDVSLQDLGYYTTSARLTDVWTGNLAASRKGKITARLRPHACIVYRVEF